MATEINSHTEAVRADCKGLSFRYSLTYEEAFEAFLLLAARGNERARRFIALLLIALAAVLTVFYAWQPYHIEYFFLALLSLASFGGVVYYPRIKAHKGAKSVEKAAGIYKVKLLPEGELLSSDGEKIPLTGDKDARAFETENLFVIRPDRMNTFCLPKRIMSSAEISKVHHLLKEYVKKFKNKPPLERVRSSDQ